MPELLLAGLLVFAQLPPSGSLPRGDLASFRAYEAELEKQLATAPDKATVTYEIARTWAAAKQWPETMNWLRRVVDLKVGLDPARDAAFADLRGSKEFAAIVAVARADTPPLSNSSRAFQVPEGDLVPENMAYDPKGRQFYFGSMSKNKVLRCSTTGQCTTFANGLGVVLGLKVRDDGLWLLSNLDKESALVHYDLSGRMMRRYAMAGAHHFNDLALARSGDIYLTDTRAGAVWRLAHGSDALARIAGQFDHANGIAISTDERLLYVATYPAGILVADLKTNSVSPITHAANLCLATIDGLYVHGGDLIAIQNAFMSPRVIRLRLTKEGLGVAGFEILERRNPLFDGVTTGVIVGKELFYMANIQDEKQSGFEPIIILKLPL